MNRGRGGGGARGGRGGGFQRREQPLGPPSRIVPAGSVLHPCEDMIVATCEDLPKDAVPYLNGRVFLENKTEIGKVDEILGPLTQMFVAVKPNAGVKPTSVPAGTKLFIDPAQQLPLDRFLPKPPVSGVLPVKKTKKPAGSGASRGSFGRGGARGGGGFSRGGGFARGGSGGFARGGARGGFARGGARSFTRGRN